MTDATLTRWAQLLLSTLARAGVRDVVISPGSRSTPFAWAALNTAGLVCHSVIDERSAGFFALGQARVSGRPSLLLCTSGSAAAQYFPAVAEASYAHLPLIVMTADRPFEAMDVGAAQTMDQTKLYGAFVRHAFELGHPEVSASALDGLERMVLQAVHTALEPLPGPVHLNARARKPLEPVAEEPDRAFRERLTRPVSRFWASRKVPHVGAIEQLAGRVREARRGLLLVGPSPVYDRERVSALLELAEITGFPLCAETTSQLRHTEASANVRRVGGFEVLLQNGSPELEPDFVLCFGAPPTTLAFSRLFAQRGVPYAVVTAQALPDPDNRASAVVWGEPSEVARQLARTLRDASSLCSEQSSFSARWQRADNAYFRCVNELLEAESSEVLSEAAAVRDVLSALPSGALLGLGNSLPVRDVDSFVAPSSRALRVWSQRGLNGIDGLVSGAAGASSAFGRSSLLLLGDVSFAHDLGGLACTRGLAQPLVICVIDNAGGRIFQELPIAKSFVSQPELEHFWLTPPRLDLEHAAATFGLQYSEAETSATLRAGLEKALQEPGATVVRARVIADSARCLRERLRARISSSIE
ncbi:MAG TPA: 2-succinyl-5-enolpyruvyl-6-hydroxy-3-cyclohexene-1-carboxylic-acid synthase [Polyangiaceae bacterium]|nr:2-succinyl-5-enolpyruvyl-6-hydroxy-3-cyclohexene-1-carboxylic-acid synthase [Polyangiaceae bacterium]